MYPSVPSSTIYNSRDMKTTKMTVGRQMNKEGVEYIYSGILLSHKQE